MATRPCLDCETLMSPLAYRCPSCRRGTFYGWLNKMLGPDFVWLVILLMLLIA